MREVVQDTIEGETYVFDYLDTEAAAEVFTEMGRMLAPALGALFSSGLGELVKDNLDLQVSDVVDKLDLNAVGQALASHVEPKTVGRILKTLCSCVIAGQGVGRLEGSKFSEHFKGRADEALKVAMVSFKVNGGPRFFKSAVSLGGVLKRAASTPVKPASIG